MMKKRSVTFNHNPLLKRDLPAWRARVVMLLIMAGSLALTGRALWLQGINHDFLQAKGESRYARTLEVPATRGRITDRQGDILAVRTPVRMIITPGTTEAGILERAYPLMKGKHHWLVLPATDDARELEQLAARAAATWLRQHLPQVEGSPQA